MARIRVRRKFVYDDNPLFPKAVGPRYFVIPENEPEQVDDFHLDVSSEDIAEESGNEVRLGINPLYIAFASVTALGLAAWMFAPPSPKVEASNKASVQPFMQPSSIRDDPPLIEMTEPQLRRHPLPPKRPENQ